MSLFIFWKIFIFSTELPNHNFFFFKFDNNISQNMFWSFYVYW